MGAAFNMKKLKRRCGETVNNRRAHNLRPSVGKQSKNALTPCEHSGRSSQHISASASPLDDTPLAGIRDHKCEAPVRPRQTSTSAEEWDVLGLGQAMVDFAATVDDNMLTTLNVPKGGRRVITVSERAQIMEMLEGYDSQVSAGGSLANTLVGLGQLAAAQDRATHGITTTTSSSSSSSMTLVGAPHSDSSHQHSSSSVRVAMSGCVGGSDALGEFARAQLQSGGVDVVGPGPSGHATGVVMVFSTPDAQRSFLSSFSSEDRIELSHELKETTARARLVLIEGYLWELPGAAEVLPALVRHAREVGTLVALTAGDAGVVERHGAKVLEAIGAGVDIWFGNEAEAAALVQHLRRQQAEQQLLALATQQQQQQQQGDCLEDEEQDFTVVQLERLGSSTANNNPSSSSSGGATLQQQQPSLLPQQQLNGQEAALQLASICPMVVVTDGSRGSYITALGQLVVVPPYWSASPPVDTCGAGDAYAAGFLYGFLLGLDLHSMGNLAAKTASAVISKHGPQLTPEDADWVVAGLVKRGRLGASAAIAAAANGVNAAAAATVQQASSAGAVSPSAASSGGNSSGSSKNSDSSTGFDFGWIGDWSGLVP